MARKNVHGVCELCQKQAKLCKSHYLGRVLHRMSFTGNEPPVVMTPKLVRVSPRQLWAHLLCEDCEQRLNERGEKPFLALCNDGDNNFRLLNLMEVAMPMTQSPNVRVSFGGLLFRDIDGTFSETVVRYSRKAMGIETEDLAYYALSVLWKGSVYKWKTFQGQESTVDLGKYQEPIRHYLTGEAGFPDGVYVITTVCTDKGSPGMCFAPSKVSESQFPMFSVLVRGIWFHIITTDEMPAGISDLCCVRSTEKVLFKEDCLERFLEAGRHIHRTATISPELR
jgi:hypothetical protein